VKIQILLLVFLLVSAAILLVKHLRPPSPRGYTRRFDRTLSRQDSSLGYAPLSTDFVGGSVEHPQSAHEADCDHHAGEAGGGCADGGGN
jgi:hypothetical protein